MKNKKLISKISRISQQNSEAFLSFTEKASMRSQLEGESTSLRNERLQTMMVDFVRGSYIIQDASFPNYQLWQQTLENTEFLDEKTASPLLKEAYQFIDKYKGKIKFDPENSIDQELFAIFLKLKLNFNEEQLMIFLRNYEQGLGGDVYEKHISPLVMDEKTGVVFRKSGASRLFDSNGVLFVSGMSTIKIAALHETPTSLLENYPSTGLMELDLKNKQQRVRHLGGVLEFAKLRLEGKSLVLPGTDKVKAFKSILSKENRDLEKEFTIAKDILIKKLKVKKKSKKIKDIIKDIRILSRYLDELKQIKGVWLPGLIEEIQQFNEFLGLRNPTSDQIAEIQGLIALSYNRLKINKQEKLQQKLTEIGFDVNNKETELKTDRNLQLAQFLFIHVEKIKNMRASDYLRFVSLITAEIGDYARDDKVLNQYFEGRIKDCQSLAEGGRFKGLFISKIDVLSKKKIISQKCLNTLTQYCDWLAKAKLSSAQLEQLDQILSMALNCLINADEHQGVVAFSPFFHLMNRELPEKAGNAGEMSRYLDEQLKDCRYLAFGNQQSPGPKTFKELFQYKLAAYKANREADSRMYYRWFQSSLVGYSKIKKTNAVQAYIDRLNDSSKRLDADSLNTLYQGSVSKHLLRFEKYIREIRTIKAEALSSSPQLVGQAKYS